MREKFISPKARYSTSTIKASAEVLRQRETKVSHVCAELLSKEKLELEKPFECFLCSVYYLPKSMECIGGNTRY